MQKNIEEIYKIYSKLVLIYLQQLTFEHYAQLDM